jgi:uncharacterized Zn-finger protein
MLRFCFKILSFQVYGLHSVIMCSDIAPTQKLYLCSVCDKAFTLQGNLDKHAVTHTGEKPYVCPICGKSFSLQGNLKKHVIIHTGQKPYSCRVCGKAFSQQGNLQKHTAIHSGEKPYSCEVCGRSFTLRGNLKKHLFTHSSQKPYACEICGKEFSHQGNLNKHVETHSEKRTLCASKTQYSLFHIGGKPPLSLLFEGMHEKRSWFVSSFKTSLWFLTWIEVGCKLMWGIMLYWNVINPVIFT